MKYGIHYAYWQHEWKADLAAACRRASALGFDLLEISGGSLLDSGEEELRELRRTADGGAAPYVHKAADYACGDIRGAFVSLEELILLEGFTE